MRWVRVYLIFILLSVAVLCILSAVGCASMIPNPPAAPPIHCPPLVAYSALEESVLKAQLPKDDIDSQIWIEDYIKLRQACEAR